MAPSPRPERVLGASHRLAGIGAALLLLTLYSWFLPEPGPNQLSRLDLAFALARRGTTSIDAYAANTIDRAEYGGRFYSDKPLGLSLFAAPVLIVADRALGIGDMGETRVAYVAHLLTIALVALPAALLAPLVAAAAWRLGAEPAAAIAAAAAMALGTALLPFATTFYAHATSASLGFLAFALATGTLGLRRSTVAALLAGLAAGAATLVEYPVVLIGGLAFVALLVRREPRPRLAAYLAGGALALLPLPIYNTVSFGAPWRLGYGFVDQRAFGGMAVGFFGLTRPTLAALEEITIGPGGLLAQSPYLLLAPVGLAILARRGERLVAGIAGATVCAFLLYNASYYLPMGGQSSGPRFLLPAIPFLALGLAFLPRATWWVITPLAAFSFVHVLAIAAVEPKTGPGHADPFWTYWLPRLRAGDVALSWAELRFGLRGADVLRPLIVPLGWAGLAAVLASIRPVRAHVAPVGLFVVASLVVWGATVLPIGAGGVPERLRTRVDDAPNQVGVVYGGSVELLGYSVPTEARPGESLDITLYWRANQPVVENLTAFVHAVGRDGVNVAGYDGPPVGAGFPTNMWPPGAIQRASYRLRVDPRAETPTALRIIAGMYGPGRPDLIPARDPSGNAIDPAPTIARLALRTSQAADDAPARASFAGGIDLLDWTLPNPTHPGGSTSGSLRWRARERPGRDATVFVQAIGPRGLVAQWDSQPLRGGYPTTLWPAGEIVEDRFVLTVSADALPGDYPLIAGLYVLPEIQRLAVTGGDHVELGRLRVEP